MFLPLERVPCQRNKSFNWQLIWALHQSWRAVISKTLPQGTSYFQVFTSRRNVKSMTFTLTWIRFWKKGGSQRYHACGNVEWMACMAWKKHYCQWNIYKIAAMCLRGLLLWRRKNIALFTFRTREKVKNNRKAVSGLQRVSNSNTSLVLMALRDIETTDTLILHSAAERAMR